MMCMMPAARMSNDPLSLLAQHRDIQFSDTVLNFKCSCRVKLLLGPWVWVLGLMFNSVFTPRNAWMNLGVQCSGVGSKALLW